MEIRYVDYGLANNFGTYIEINEDLKLYPELHDAILDHELSHTSEKGFTKKDFILDISPSKVKYGDLLKFMVRHPKSLTQFAPLYIKNKEIVYDVNMIIVYSFIILSIVIGFYIGNK